MAVMKTSKKRVRNTAVRDKGYTNTSDGLQKAPSYLTSADQWVTGNTGNTVRNKRRGKKVSLKLFLVSHMGYSSEIQSLAHHETLHGGLICIALRLSVCL